MPFDTNVIPTTGRSQAAMAAHIQLWKESEDIWKVYNPSNKDYIVYFDRRRSNQKWVVPNKDKDIGFGKGMQHMPKYAMILYRDHMGVEMINAKSEELWNAEKGNYRLEDRAKMEEANALRTNNPEEWKRIIPILVKGIVTRFGGDDILDELEPEAPNTMGMNAADTAMAELNMNDADVGTIEELEQRKQDFITQVQK